ncbi:MAG TPA: PTS sugar transporter subunit IIB [Deltaproteobacteria bacterium]|nr:PTS sugar transporter subunit IIB [Deltaproteobacteria bacterium]
MNIVLVRVDDRFIHGQILESWIPHLNVQGVVIVNDELACDQIQKTIMSMAIPERILLRIVGFDGAARMDEDCELDGKRTLVIVSSIKDAHRLLTAGVGYKRLNIGNNKASSNACQISYSVWMDEEDRRLVNEIMEQGVEITVQSVPRERSIDLKSLIGAVWT